LAISGSLKATVLDAEAIRRSLTRIAHEIVERNRGVEDLVVGGVMSKGVPLGSRLAAKLHELEERPVPVGELDPGRHRDDLHLRTPAARPESSVAPIDGRPGVLGDDVIWHGRTVRAAMDALLEFGRPRSIQLAVLVDRGHRELPIRPDYVGKNVPTSESERVEVLLQETHGAALAVILHA